MIVWILIIVGAVALDQATKILVMNFLDREEPLVLIEGIFRFTYVENSGAAFGSFDDNRWVFMIISVLGIIAMIVYLWKFRPESKLACTALSMIIGGGIGNMIDRLFYKGTLPHTEGKNVVIDFLDFCAFPDLWPWVFNVADSFVCVTPERRQALGNCRLIPFLGWPVILLRHRQIRLLNVMVRKVVRILVFRNLCASNGLDVLVLEMLWNRLHRARLNIGHRLGNRHAARIRLGSRRKVSRCL